MSRATAAALVVSTMLFAASAAADVYIPAPVVRAVLDLHVAMVAASAAPDAPSEDVASVERETRAQLAAAQARVRRCLANVDLREDPLRNRARRIELRMQLDRSGRPTRVWVQRDDGMPRGARRCVLEPLRAMSIRPAPRGGVLVRVVYELT